LRKQKATGVAGTVVIVVVTVDQAHQITQPALNQTPAEIASAQPRPGSTHFSPMNFVKVSLQIPAGSFD
jgi:hypothetical protein